MRDDVGARRVEDRLRADGGRRATAVGRGLDNHDLLDAERPEPEEATDPDGAGAEHDRGPPGLGPALADGVVRDRERLGQRAGGRADARRQAVGHRPVHDGVLGEPAAARPHAVAQHLLAQVVEARRAGCARAARPQRRDGHEVTRSERLSPGRAVVGVRAELDDLGRELVPDDDGQGRRAHRAVVELVEVGAAQPVVQRPDEHLARARRRIRHRLDPDVARPVVPRCPHARQPPTPAPSTFLARENRNIYGVQRAKNERATQRQLMRPGMGLGLFGRMSPGWMPNHDASVA